MYLPYLRGKRFELETLLGVPSSVYGNTLPVIEPLNISSGKYYQKLAEQNIPLILVMNPQLPPRGKLSISTVQSNLVDTRLSNHSSLVLGLIIDQYMTVTDIAAFLDSNSARSKAIIFRHNPIPVILASINDLLKSKNPLYLVFDDKKTSIRTRSLFQWHPQKILISDGFQRMDRNIDYPESSSFDSNYASWHTDGWSGIGDYLSVGDHYKDGGGQPFVVTLHLTVQTTNGLEVRHFSSTLNSTIQGGASPKFLEACKLLTNYANNVGLSSSGIDMYKDWENRSHFPHLGAAKKASMQHHIELISKIL